MPEPDFDPNTGEIIENRPTKAADGGRIPPPAASLADTLRLLDGGQVELDASAAMRELVRKMEAHAVTNRLKAKGKFTLSLDLTLENGAFVVKPSFKVVLPEQAQRGTIFFGLSDGRLSRTPPLPEHFFSDVRDRPRFRRGVAVLTTVESFIGHVNRFGDEDTVIFADDNRTSPSLLAVLDYHRADVDVPMEGEPGSERGIGEYRHGKHRSLFRFPLSDEWKAWTGANHKVFSMVEFAVFLEKHIGDIAIAGDDYPEETARFVAINGGDSMIADYATLVELSRGLKVHENATVEEANVLASGEGTILFSTEHRTSRAGSNDLVRVPTMFFIAIPILNKGALYRIPAALRYRKTAEGVKFWFDLWREDRSFDHAFNEVVSKVDNEALGTILFGTPE